MHMHMHTCTCANPREVEQIYCPVRVDTIQKFLGRDLTCVHSRKIPENVNNFLSITEIYTTFKSLSGYIYCLKTDTAEIIAASVTWTQ